MRSDTLGKWIQEHDRKRSIGVTTLPRENANVLIFIERGLNPTIIKKRSRDPA